MNLFKYNEHFQLSLFTQCIYIYNLYYFFFFSAMLADIDYNLLVDATVASTKENIFN